MWFLTRPVSFVIGVTLTFLLVLLLGIPFRLLKWTRHPLLSAFLSGLTSAGFLLLRAYQRNDAPPHLEEFILFYLFAVGLAARFYTYRDGKKARKAGRVLGPVLAPVGTQP